MRLALHQAQLAADAGEVPVGAVLVSSDGEVLATACNQTERSADPTAHAELVCIRGAAAARGAWRLLHATLYVTLEPCPMCAGALLQSRVGTVVYGARNTLLGADGSWISMLPRTAASAHHSDSGSHEGSSGEPLPAGSERGISEEAAAPNEGAMAAAQPARPHPFHPNMEVRRGVLAAECGGLMRSFFALRRKQAAAAAGKAPLQAEAAAAE
jgi:tRNA(adenine34) deaminase